MNGVDTVRIRRVKIQITERLNIAVETSTQKSHLNFFVAVGPYVPARGLAASMYLCHRSFIDFIPSFCLFVKVKFKIKVIRHLRE